VVVLLRCGLHLWLVGVRWLVLLVWVLWLVVLRLHMLHRILIWVLLGVVLWVIFGVGGRCWLIVLLGVDALGGSDDS